MQTQKLHRLQSLGRAHNITFTKGSLGASERK